MKIKNAHLLTSTEFLSKISAEDHEIPIAFKISTIINRVNEAIKPVNELRQKIVTESMLKNDKGEPIFLDVDKKFLALSDAGYKKLNELLELESEVAVTDVFTMAELQDAKIKLKGGQVEALKWMIK